MKVEYRHRMETIELKPDEQFPELWYKEYSDGHRFYLPSSTYDRLILTVTVYVVIWKSLFASITVAMTEDVDPNKLDPKGALDRARRKCWYFLLKDGHCRYYLDEVRSWWAVWTWWNDRPPKLFGRGNHRD